MPKTRFLLPLALALSLAVGLLSHAASARVEAEARYSKAQAFSGALRYLRVDLGYDVVEKDAEAAYLIFKYDLPGQAKQTSTGTVEIVQGDTSVHIYVKLPKLPEYHERVLRDGLLRKLREEYGDPQPLPRKPEPPPSDAGSDAEP